MTHGKSTLLHDACRAGDLETVQRLIDADPSTAYDMTTQDVGDGWGPLHLAAMKGGLALVKTLLDLGCEGKPDRYGFTPVGWARLLGSPEIVAMLIAAGVADSNAPEQPYSCAIRSKDEWLVRRLREAGTSLENVANESFLKEAAREGLVEAVRLLLDAGTDPDGLAGYSDEPTALMLAAQAGHLSVAHLLVERGARLDRNHSWWGNPLHYAAAAGHREVVAYFLSLTGDNRPGGWPVHADATPLHVAVMGGHLDVVALLLEGHSYQDNDRDAFGKTPLDWAVQNGNHDIARLLRDSQAKR